MYTGMIASELRAIGLCEWFWRRVEGCSSAIAGQRQVSNLGKSEEVIEIYPDPPLGLADERNDSRKDFHVFWRVIDGREYSSVPQVEIDRWVNIKLLEEMRTAPNGPSFSTDG